MGAYLEAGPLCATPSEAHGLLCGLICGGDRSPVDTWLAQVAPGADAGDVLAAEARAALRDRGLAIEHQLREADAFVSFPAGDETDSLARRAESLYDWVRGFMFALGVLGVSESSLSDQGREILRDLAAMTQMDLDDLDESEENEQSLFEVTEFIRVAAMLIHDERAAAHREARAP